MELAGKTAIVTGGGRGIGEGISHVLAREGANVVVMGRHANEVEAVAAAIRASGGSGLAVVADVTDWNSLEAMTRATVARFGGIDVLVNNAGIEGPPCLVGTCLRSSGTGCWESTSGACSCAARRCCRR
jgi:NAD(P)-dependent dehydrogenase (short-subunit alcohol dehydrogenase family)